MHLIEARNLTKDYGQGKGVFDLDFSLEEGEVFGYLGPNGAGKTTTIRNLMGFLRPDVGTCAIFGLDCWKDSAKIKERLGYLPGEIAFFEDMTGSAFLDLMAAMRGHHAAPRREELLRRFDLDPRGKIKKMSKGMKQKLALIAAFMHDPSVLILDEPTAGLDPLMQNYFIDLILEEKKRGKTIFMSSHSFEEVGRTCHRVGIIREGYLVAVESIETLLSSQRKAFHVTFRHAEDAKRFEKEPFATEPTNTQTLKVQITGDLNPFLHTLGSFDVQDLHIASQNLEEVFLDYYGGDAHV